MATKLDDLDFNPFYRQLETTFQNKFDEAQQKCWLLCVPQRNSIKNEKITKRFIDTHILKPSPFIKGHYISTDAEESITIEIEGKTIYTDSDSINILSEEIAYNREYKRFRILMIDKPLHPKFRKQSEDTTDSKPQSFKNSYLDCREFLQTFPQHHEPLAKLDKKMRQFSRNYMILPEYLHDASLKLQEIIKFGWQLCINSHQPSLQADDPLSTEIHGAIESYVLLIIHQKLFSVIKQKSSREDKILSDKLQELYNLHLSADQLGVKPEFCCQTPNALVELASLNAQSSPALKLYCLKATLEMLSEDVKSATLPLSGLKNPSCLTSDDLIPILVTVLVQSRPQYLESNLYYIQNFSWQLSANSKLSYSLVTFQAAKEFIKTLNISHLKPSNNRLKKEMSLKELMEVTVELQKNTPKNGNYTHKHDNVTSPIDRKLADITRMIEASAKELTEQKENMGASQRQSFENEKKTNASGLGDFLSNLQATALGFGYGKQT